VEKGAFPLIYQIEVSSFGSSLYEATATHKISAQVFLVVVCFYSCISHCLEYKYLA